MSAPDGRALVLVVGVGRSGTSLLAGILGQLGFHIPRPEVKANSTNPRGFGEPRWVVDFHAALLRSQRITVNDSRPAAWEPAARAGEDPASSPRCATGSRDSCGRPTLSWSRTRAPSGFCRSGCAAPRSSA
jgi:hypothetical protein